MVKKYPIGTKIRFMWPTHDTNKTGTIVAIDSDGCPMIYLPDGDRQHRRNDISYTWICSWGQIKSLKNEQLEFEFTYQNV